MQNSKKNLAIFSFSFLILAVYSSVSFAQMEVETKPKDEKIKEATRITDFSRVSQTLGLSNTQLATVIRDSGADPSLTVWNDIFKQLHVSEKGMYKKELNHDLVAEYAQLALLSADLPFTSGEIDSILKTWSNPEIEELIRVLKITRSKASSTASSKAIFNQELSGYPVLRDAVVRDWASQLDQAAELFGKDHSEKGAWTSFREILREKSLTVSQKNSLLADLYQAHMTGTPKGGDNFPAKQRALVMLQQKLEASKSSGGYSFSRDEAHQTVKALADSGILGTGYWDQEDWARATYYHGRLRTDYWKGELQELADAYHIDISFRPNQNESSLTTRAVTFTVRGRRIAVNNFWASYCKKYKNR